MATKIKIGHAATSEGIVDENTGEVSYRDGEAGDQHGNEVLIVEEYDIMAPKKPNKEAFRADIVLRPKSRALARKSALACEAACANDNIGYSQFDLKDPNRLQRNTLYDEALKASFNLAEITKPCNTDCAAFMTVCAVAGGASFSYYANDADRNAPITTTMHKLFTSTGEYEILSDEKHITITDYLKRGDILVDKNYHTIMVLENGCKMPNTDNTKITVSIDSITSTQVSAVARAVALENNKESLLTDDETALFYWTYAVKSLTDESTDLLEKKLEFKKGTSKFTLSGLQPNSSYIIYVIAREANGETAITSPNVIVTTLFNYPTEVRNLSVELDSVASANPKATISFVEPKSWGSTGYSQGYRLFLFINGSIAGYSDELIRANTASPVHRTIALTDISKKVTITDHDSIQLGVLPWLKSLDGTFYTNNELLSCSRVFVNTSKAATIHKLFIKIKDIFKHTLLYKTN